MQKYDAHTPKVNDYENKYVLSTENQHFRRHIFIFYMGLLTNHIYYYVFDCQAITYLAPLQHVEKQRHTHINSPNIRTN